MIDPTLRTAYLNTRYLVTVGGQYLTLKIGEASPELDDMLGARSVEMAAVVTAWNPRSQCLPREENLDRGNALSSVVHDLGLETLPVVATLGDPHWIEHGLLILGIHEGLACQLGRQFAQNAIVTVTRGNVPQLIELINPGEAS